MSHSTSSEPSGAADAQAHFYSAGHDYILGSPHLRHPRLFRALVASISASLDALEARGLDRTVLEVGAGDGAFVEPLLARGCRVIATEASPTSVTQLSRQYGGNPMFRALYDADGSLAPLGDRRVSLLLFASVLHHIPDYLGAIEAAVAAHLRPGGTLITLQDPLWYPTLPTGVHALSEAAFLSWRLTQGHYFRGVASRIRRARRAYDADKLGDMVEYHVVRDGIDQVAVECLASAQFATVRLVKYWSTWLSPLQALGERLTVANTFQMIAEDRT